MISVGKKHLLFENGLKTKISLLHISKSLSNHGIFKVIKYGIGGKWSFRNSIFMLYSYLGLADYLIGDSNSRKRSRDSLALTGQPLDDDVKVEDASEAPVNER